MLQDETPEGTVPEGPLEMKQRRGPFFARDLIAVREFLPFPESSCELLLALHPARTSVRLARAARREPAVMASDPDRLGLAEVAKRIDPTSLRNHRNC